MMGSSSDNLKIVTVESATSNTEIRLKNKEEIWLDQTWSIKTINKRGIAMNYPQNCNVLNQHWGVSWWYTYLTTTGFDFSFCKNADTAYQRARTKFNKDFVPMFSRDIPDKPFDFETNRNLQDATYLMAWNEPELEKHGDTTPEEAATQWPKIVSIAKDYNLKIVARCATIEKGKEWMHKFLAICKKVWQTL